MPFGPPEVGRRAAAVLPRAELHVVEGGHAPWLRRAEAVGREKRASVRSTSWTL